MANETNTTVESELTFEESVEIIKKHKKKSIIAITVDSIIDVGLIAGTIAGIATGHYKTAAITGTLAAVDTAILTKNSVDLYKANKILKTTKESNKEEN